MNEKEQIKRLNEIKQKIEAIADDIQSLKLDIADNNVKRSFSISLDDVYKAFGSKKKNYVIRLKHAFLENHIATVEDLMNMNINQLLNMDGIGSETIRLLIKKLSSLGIEYYPVER